MEAQERRRAVVPKKRKRRKSSKRRDVVSRLKAVIWYEVVRGLTGLTDDELDEKFLDVPGYVHYDESGRARAFRSIGYYGSNPDLTSKRGISLVSSARRHDKRLAVAEDIFRSAFWLLCSHPRPELRDIEQIIGKQLQKKGLFRPNHLEAIALQLRSGDKPSWNPGLSEHYKNSVVSAIELGTIEGLMLASALYLEALAHTELEQALFLKKLLLRTLKAFIDKWKFRPDTSRALQSLVGARILRNRWTYPDLRQFVNEVPGIMAYTIGGNANPDTKVRVATMSRSLPAFALFRAYAASEMANSTSVDAYLYPIVRNTEEIKKIVENTDAILHEEAESVFGKDYFKW